MSLIFGDSLCQGFQAKDLTVESYPGFTLAQLVELDQRQIGLSMSSFWQG
jgi:hypothetical protein